MENNILEVLKPGLFTTIQDLGRYGYQQYGLVVAGAMDPFSLQVANILVGNARHDAALEITLQGPEILFHQTTLIALCGANLSPTLDQLPVPLWKSVLVKKGQILRFGQPKSGARTYLSVAGAFQIEPVLGSRSTYTKAVLGGFAGRSLQKGDRLLLGNPKVSLKKVVNRFLHPEKIPRYSVYTKVRVILGPDFAAFSKEAIDTFLTSIYTVTKQSDRMGYRLSGAMIHQEGSADIISEGIAWGTVQVPANGEPIILLADRQTTGGYSRIATVIAVDLAVVAQLKMGDQLSFVAINVDQAQQLYIEQENFLRKLSVSTRSVMRSVF